MFWRNRLFLCPNLNLRVSLLNTLLPLVVCLSTAISTAGQLTVTNIKDLFKQAQKEGRKGRAAEAEKLYRQIIEVDPRNSDAKLAMAYLLVKQRRIREAYELSFDIAKTEPKNSRAYAVLGATFLTAGRFHEARTCFITSIQLNRKEDLAWAGLGMLEFYENRIEDSISDLEEATFREPNEPDYQFALGQVSARAERYKEAADAYKRFLMISNDLDSDRRARIKGLVNFLNYLGQKTSLYNTDGGAQTNVPFALIGNRPVIKVRVNGRDDSLNFVLDTGSGISVISDKTAHKLKINPVTRGGYARGIGGDGKFEIVYGFLRDVSIGDVRIRNVPVYIREFHTTNEDIDGYIGLSLISKFLTTIDYGSLTFALTKKPAEPSGTTDQDLSLPLRLTSSGFLSGEVKLEGVDDTFNFIVDTGASVSVISDEIASLQPVSRYSRSEKMRVVGSAGITDDVPSFMLPRVTFGNNTREGVAAIALDLDLINEASGFQQAGILGGNFLRNYRLTFDFKNSKVKFVPISQEK
jgi:tetratricopeptide (TPR) repeat protein/predicted aspartyl protease